MKNNEDSNKKSEELFDRLNIPFEERKKYYKKYDRDVESAKLFFSNNSLDILKLKE